MLDGQPLILGAGIHQISGEAYHADPAPEPSLSSTIAKIFIRETPLHAWTACPRLNPDHVPTTKKALDIGTAAHSAVLGVGSGFAVIPDEHLKKDGSVNGGSAAYKEWVADARASGLTPLKAEEIAHVKNMATAVRSRLAAMGIRLDPAHSERVALAQIDGIWCRCMVDNAPADPRLPLYDLKTTAGSVHPDALARTVADCDYDVQAAHYLRTWKEATGEDRRFRFIFVEKSAPYEVGVIELYNDGSLRPAEDFEADEPLTGDWFADAEAKLARARRQWRACLDSGEWPGYPPRVALIGAPVWHRKAAATAAQYDTILPRKPTAEALAAAAKFQSPV